MAAVLYEPAFTVLAKHFPATGERRRAMTAMTLVAALASFIFMPLSQALIDAHGWRDALIVLAVILAAITVPLHALVAAPGSASRARARDGRRRREAVRCRRRRRYARRRSGCCRERSCWRRWRRSRWRCMPSRSCSSDGQSPAFAAFAVGLVGISQIPGRLLFAPIAARLPRPAAMASVFVLIATGIAIVVSTNSTVGVAVGLVVLGMGNGMSTLARATAFADLYGPGAYGTIAAVAGAMTTGARAVGPVAGAVYAALFGYVALLWALAALALVAAALAWRAEHAAALHPMTAAADR